MEELKRIIREEKELLQHVESLLEGFKDMKGDFKELVALIKIFIQKQDSFMNSLMERDS